MSKTRVRIPEIVHEYATYMQTTDDLQLSEGSSSTTLKWQDWGWTAAQSAVWTSFREQSDVLYPKYADENHKDTAVKDEMHLLIKNTRKYDNDKLTGNHLLDKVALNGTIDDCETFRVKRGTPLAGLNHSGSSASKVAVGSATGTGTGSEKPGISIRKYDVGEHQLSLYNLTAPKGHGLPKGVKFLKVYRYIGTAAVPPTSVKQYIFIGNAKHGLELSSFSDSDLEAFPAPTEVFAWYIARYESTKGILGDAGSSIRAQILRPE